MSIAQHHAGCYLAFQELCETARGLDQYRYDLRDEFDKYTLWAGNVGAAHSGRTYKLSLDYRLREASVYRDEVSKLLDILKHQIGKAHQIVRGDRTPFEDFSSDSGSDTVESTQLEVEAPSAEEESPWEISSDSETELPLSQRKQSASGNVSTPGAASSSIPAGSLQRTVGDRSQGITELRQLLESIRLTVTCLYKIPLRKPAPTDRLSDKSIEEVAYYQSFDALYVRDKFPDERLDAQVTLRLGKMITRRRQLLLYRKKHKENLRTEAITPNSQFAAPVGKRVVETEPGANGSHMRPIQKSQSQPESSYVTSKTKASTLRAEELPSIDPFAPSVAESDSGTSLAASKATQGIRVEVPPRPCDHDGLGMSRFECKYCFLTPYIRSDRVWKKHVLNDLQPYVCTHPNCNLPDHLFENRDAWYNHETQHHRVEFFCNTTKHQAYARQTDFEIHMKQDHDTPPGALSALLDVFRRPSTCLGGLCSLCYCQTNNLKSHVSRHLEQVALFAVPRIDYSVDDEDLDGRSDVSQNNAKGSISREGGDTISRNSEGSSEVSEDIPPVTGDVGAGKYEASPEEAMEETDIPDTEDPDWDVVTDKFSKARTHDEPKSTGGSGLDPPDMRNQLQEHQDIIDWLTPTDYSTEQANFLSQRLEGTGMWLLDSDRFQKWVNGSNQTLLCQGIPGAGKTVMSSIVTEYLYNRFGNDASIACLYCNFRRQHEQLPADLLASLLRQTVRGQPMPEIMNSLVERHRHKGTRPSLEEISEVLHSVIANNSRAYIIIDALDECQVSDEYREMFLSEVFKLQAKTRANLFVTSRFIPRIERGFKECMSIEIRANEEDVRRYIDGYMLWVSFSPSPELREDIKSRITNEIDGMFPLARHYLDSLIRTRSPRAIRAALEMLPTGIEGYDIEYMDAMERIGRQIAVSRDFAKQVLSWITCAKRPLTTTELQHALAVRIGDPELDEGSLPEVEDMVSFCAGLVTIDVASDTIRFIHYTAEEYFTRTQESWFPNAQTDIAGTCVTYLLFDTFGAGPCATDEELIARLRLNPLYDYAARNWGRHAHKISAQVERLTLDLLENDAKVAAASQAMTAISGYLCDDQISSLQMRGVHLAAYFGLEKMMAALIKNGHDPNTKDTHDETPLSWTARNGHEAVAKLLLANEDIDPDSEDASGQTPLSWATRYGHETVVKLLLSHASVNPESEDEVYGRTPLSWAAGNGHEEIVKLLLAHPGVGLNSKDNSGQTPLLWAAGNGHKTIVELLLAQVGIDPDAKDWYDQTPLSWTARYGHVAVACLLLVLTQVDPDSKSAAGRTPLSRAAGHGHPGVVELLLVRTNVVDIDSKDIYDRTPLSFAAENGHVVVVELLLKHAHVNPDSRDGSLRTPLSWAAGNGHEAVVKLLLVHHGVDLNSKDNGGRMPLSWAAQNGYEAVVELLLARDDITRDSKDVVEGRTPLSWAARNGREATVKLLLAQPGVDPDSRDIRGQTPLSLAARNGHEAVVKLLLANGGVDLCSGDASGQTPLVLAAGNGHDSIAKLLEFAMA